MKTAKVKKAKQNLTKILIPKRVVETLGWKFRHVERGDAGGVIIHLHVNGQNVILDLEGDDVAQITDMWNAVLAENAELETVGSHYEQPNVETIPPELHS